jgi:hypothetical protein
MYQFSQRFKITTLILMGLGLLGLGYGFMSAPSTIEEAKAMMASHEGGHGEEHGSADHPTLAEAHHGSAEAHHGSNTESSQSEGHGDSMNHDAHAAVAEDHGSSHDQHVLDQMKNRPWSAFYVSALFSFLIALGVLAFYAINRAAQAGWSPLLFRVMEGITSYLIPGGIILFAFFVLSGLHMNHLFVWMDADVVAHDKLIQNKSGYLNTPFFLIRAAIYIGGWIAYRQYSRKLSLAEETASDNKPFVTNFKLAAGFLAFFLVSESMMSWDWIMSVDPHWFSTLFGWYVFASFFVSGITVIALFTLYLKSKGLLESVNNSHIHDLAKFMFGISIFWTYLWFSQFMLIWYADIPEEVTYYVMRFEAYKVPFLGMLVLNFIFPLLVIMRSDYKRIPWFVQTVGIVILTGHYFDFYNMIMPGTVGAHWSFGIPELGGILFFTGLFLYAVATALTKVAVEPKGNALLEESKHFHY